MSENPEKRLVSKKSYYLAEGKFMSLIVVGTCSLGLSLLMLCATVAVIVYYWDESLWNMIFSALAFGSICAFFLINAVKMLGRASEVEKVEIVTPQNAHMLPVQETLVRSSEAPPSQQQAELLRSAPQGHETPSEELLRATTRNGQDE